MGEFYFTPVIAKPRRENEKKTILKTSWIILHPARMDKNALLTQKHAFP